MSAALQLHKYLLANRINPGSALSAQSPGGMWTLPLWGLDHVLPSPHLGRVRWPLWASC